MYSILGADTSATTSCST